tara:strand:+ start:2214 stop:3224 length:1011 start_codon:yes stop_codon:yes gene_type:complete
MNLKNTYSIGVLVMFYEIEMFIEYIDACIQMTEDIENKSNLYFDFCFNLSEYFENIDTDKISVQELNEKFEYQMNRLREVGLTNINVDIKNNNDSVYNIAAYRRDLNYNYCDKVDFVLWGETDSMWPKETFQSIESVDGYAKQQNINRYILTFAYRKMWDDGWKPLEHVDMTDLPFVDGEEWNLNAPESPKSYMTLEKMNEINSRYDELDIRILNYPKFDGSCLVISSDLIKSGVNIPHALLCSGEDTSMGVMAKTICGDSYVQFIVKNILRVHNRRHPRKRHYISDENNPMGWCDERKGDWWDILMNRSKENLYKLSNNQSKFITFDEVLEEIKK